MTEERWKKIEKDGITSGRVEVEVLEALRESRERAGELEESLQNKIASAIAHRACCGTEHDPQNGKLHGYCVVCGVPWPCETAQTYLSRREA